MAKEAAKTIARMAYLVPEGARNAKGLPQFLKEQPQIKFISLMGVDLGGNDTDEKIPVELVLKNPADYLEGAVETDGSSVVLPGIATLNNGKVDLIADNSVNWFIDYNYENIDTETGRPVGTLRIPSFLEHSNGRVDSRSILRKAVQYAEQSLLDLIKSNKNLAKQLGISPNQIARLIFTAGTEVEMWVRTPGNEAEAEKLSVSQVLQEQYWKRTKGTVRTALEQSLIMLQRYGMTPEMGHKEVGGIKSRVTGEGKLADIMEQLEIDWRFNEALQAADNELLARITIKEVFRRHGLEASFVAKPIEGVAGSGEHTHVGIAAQMKDGSVKNLFAPTDMKKDFLSPVGWGAIMGILKNWEVINAFVTSTNDAFNRLKPGFEAPVAVVASIGHSVDEPSRNRTVLAGLVRDMDNPRATRFEVRAPNPHTNTYLALAAFYMAILDGIEYVASNNKSSKDLEAEFSKAPEADAGYLEQGRAYRSEEDVFEHYTEEERIRLFGVPPATVWQAIQNLKCYSNKTAVLQKGDVFSNLILASYEEGTRLRWLMELRDRIIPDNLARVRSLVKLHTPQTGDSVDDANWNKVQSLRLALAKDTAEQKSLFSQIREAIANSEYERVSNLQLEMTDKMSELSKAYTMYRTNIIDLPQDQREVSLNGNGHATPSYPLKSGAIE